MLRALDCDEEWVNIPSIVREALREVAALVQCCRSDQQKTVTSFKETNTLVSEMMTNARKYEFSIADRLSVTEKNVNDMKSTHGGSLHKLQVTLDSISGTVADISQAQSNLHGDVARLADQVDLVGREVVFIEEKSSKFDKKLPEFAEKEDLRKIVTLVDERISQEAGQSLKEIEELNRKFSSFNLSEDSKLSAKLRGLRENLLFECEQRWKCCQDDVDEFKKLFEKRVASVDSELRRVSETAHQMKEAAEISTGEFLQVKRSFSEALRETDALLLREQTSREVAIHTMNDAMCVGFRRLQSEMATALLNVDSRIAAAHGSENLVNTVRREAELIVRNHYHNTAERLIQSAKDETERSCAFVLEQTKHDFHEVLQGMQVSVTTLEKVCESTTADSYNNAQLLSGVQEQFLQLLIVHRELSEQLAKSEATARDQRDDIRRQFAEVSLLERDAGLLSLEQDATITKQSLNEAHAQIGQLSRELAELLDISNSSFASLKKIQTEVTVLCTTIDSFGDVEKLCTKHDLEILHNSIFEEHRTTRRQRLAEDISSEAVADRRFREVDITGDLRRFSRQVDELALKINTAQLVADEVQMRSTEAINRFAQSVYTREQMDALLQSNTFTTMSRLALKANADDVETRFETVRAKVILEARLCARQEVSQLSIQLENTVSVDELQRMFGARNIE